MQVSPRTPTWRVAQGASVYDDSWLFDTNLDNFYEQEVIDHVIAQGTFMHMDAAASMYGMNADMDVDMNEQSPYQQQQWQQGLSAGMGRALLPPSAAAAAAGSSRLRMPQRPSGPAYDNFMPIVSPDHAITPSEGGSGSEQQQQREQSMDVDGETPRGGQSAAAAAGFGAALTELQAEEQLDQQQLQQLSPVQQLLRGGRPTWPLMPTPETVLEVLRTKGLDGLVVYMDEGSFADYNKESVSFTEGQGTKMSAGWGLGVFCGPRNTKGGGVRLHWCDMLS